MSFLNPVLAAWQRVRGLPRQFFGESPFGGDCRPTRIPLWAPFANRPSFPFPHPWNYDDPIRILETYFHGAEQERGAGRHNRYLEVPGFSPILVSRDPAIIRAITTETGEHSGQFNRDTLPSTGIARATGPDTLLFSNGALWKRQRMISASPFGKTTLFQPELFHEFEITFRQTVRSRLELLQKHLEASGQRSIVLPLEPEIKAVMLEMLVNNFFGAELPYERLRNEFVPALERVIQLIVRDTVTNFTGVPVWQMPAITPRIRQARADFALFEELVDHVLLPRRTSRGLWKQFRSEAPDAALRSNLKVFLAGALEATTSYASWAIAHLARNAVAREKLFREVQGIDCYTPEGLVQARYLGHVLDESLRLTPALYFLPRQATVDTEVKTSDGRIMQIPAGTHILLDVWHANRHDDHWGGSLTGFAASAFAPERWENIAAQGRASKDFLHFGFGHGPRVCPGKHLGQLEVALVVGALIQKFQLRAITPGYEVKAGVSTKPADGTLVELQLR